MRSKIKGLLLIIVICLISIYSIKDVNALNVEGLEKVYSFKYGTSYYKYYDSSAHFFGNNILRLMNNTDEVNVALYDYSGKNLYKSNELPFRPYISNQFQSDGVYLINDKYCVQFNNRFVIFNKNYEYEKIINDNVRLCEGRMITSEYNTSTHSNIYYYYDENFNKQLLDSSDPLYQNYYNNCSQKGYDNIIENNRQWICSDNDCYVDLPYSNNYYVRNEYYYNYDSWMKDSKVSIYDSNNNLVKEIFNKNNTEIFNIDIKENKILINYAYYDGIPFPIDENDYYDTYYIDYSSQKHLYIEIYDITKNYSDEILLRMSDKKNTDLRNFFPDFTGNVKWFVSDESIIRIDNNNIIPLKVGETDVIGSDENSSYKLRVKVVADDLLTNPNTYVNFLPIFIILLIGTGYFIISKKTKKSN